jgi:hypothetical protein
MAQARSGGGINSSVVVREGIRSAPRTTNVVNPRGLSQYGTATGSMLNKQGSFTSRNSAEPVFDAPKADRVPMGNALVNDVGKGSPGAGRQVLRAGSQGQHGAPAGPAPVQGRDIFREYPTSQSQGNTGSFVQKR